MISSFFNWRTGLALVAIAIISGTILYSRMLANKIAAEEKQRVEQWVEAGKLLVKDSSGISDRLVGAIISANTTIPIIETDEQGHIIQHVNLDSNKVVSDTSYVRRLLEGFRADREPIKWTDPLDASKSNLYYYGHTPLLDQVKYYPIIQLVIVALFIILTMVAISTNYRSRQNQVWAGMAKETAHQLGTPLTSLKGWVEMMKENPSAEKVVAEMTKDIDRLQLISDRFGKIGSIPHLEPHDVIQQAHQMIEYIRKRSPERVQFLFDTGQSTSLMAPISPPLFDWVIENLLKNALDAMEGKGKITVRIKDEQGNVVVDVQDTGKGILRKHISKVFDPGFTTKKRGWGLGLSLAKRIVEQYHKGQLFVKESEAGKGTTFRIILKK